MIFEEKAFYVDLIKNDDLNDIVQVYNSNKHFLVNHMGKCEITYEWIFQELESMRKINFSSCKVVEKISGKIIGIIDFKIDKETYLSLLMLHNDYKNKGFGKVIYKSLEEYAKSLGSQCIRIDVVTNYDTAVLDFWTRNGFNKLKDVELNWTGKILPAIVMKKNI